MKLTIIAMTKKIKKALRIKKIIFKKKLNYVYYAITCVKIKAL